MPACGGIIETPSTRGSGAVGGVIGLKPPGAKFTEGVGLFSFMLPRMFCLKLFWTLSGRRKICAVDTLQNNKPMRIAAAMVSEFFIFVLCY